MSTSAARDLNDTCDCVRADTAPLATAVAPVFCEVPVFVDERDLATMRRAVTLIEATSRLPGWADAADIPAPHRRDPGPRGVLMGYDFHLTDDGPRLIEVNTNAGGALLATELLRAHDRGEAATRFEAALVDSFRADWRAARGDAPLRSVAIVDEAPTTQFLYPEFQRYQALFQAAGLTAVIVAPADLHTADGVLWAGDVRIDLVYLRSTDFDLSGPASAALAEAWAHDLAVLTPNPHVHARVADKRRLITLSDDHTLQRLGLSDEDRALLTAVVPRTVPVTVDSADTLWAERKRWFFKPATGFGSRAALRGDKVTRGRWADVLASVAAGEPWVAQATVPPSTRTVPGADGPLKVDLRAIAHDGVVHGFFARVYDGQTTNLRTAGGGFATVLSSDGPCCSVPEPPRALSSADPGL